MLASSTLASAGHANLAGSLEDTVGGVGGTPPVVPGAGVYGDADPAVTLVALLTGAADL